MRRIPVLFDSFPEFIIAFINIGFVVMMIGIVYVGISKARIFSDPTQRGGGVDIHTPFTR